MTDESSDWVIEEAARRGVKIRVLVEGDITDAKPVKFASRTGYERLLALGAEIYEYQPTMMHAKSLVVDSVWSIIGSSNFDNRSLELNDELNHRGCRSEARAARSPDSSNATSRSRGGSSWKAGAAGRSGRRRGSGSGASSARFSDKPA